MKCDARGPGLNNQICTAYAHKIWNFEDSDRTDHDSDGYYPGHKVRKEAYNIMLENHKDNMFQKQEEAEAIRERNI
eukprot:9255519-Heterocapsa_arctica.AAC.1